MGERFVILEHVLPADANRATHWDLMFERSSDLATWALSGPPDQVTAIRADELPAHRRCYLDYEGPISGGRGSVRRWDFGTYRWESHSDTEIAGSLQGGRVRGRFRLRCDSESKQWHFEWL